MKGNYISISEKPNHHGERFVSSQNELNGWCHTEKLKYQFQEFLSNEEIGQELGGN